MIDRTRSGRRVVEAAEGQRDPQGERPARHRSAARRRPRQPGAVGTGRCSRGRTARGPSSPGAPPESRNARDRVEQDVAGAASGRYTCATRASRASASPASARSGSSASARTGRGAPGQAGAARSPDSAARVTALASLEVAGPRPDHDRPVAERRAAARGRSRRVADGRGRPPGARRARRPWRRSPAAAPARCTPGQHLSRSADPARRRRPPRSVRCELPAERGELAGSGSPAIATPRTSPSMTRASSRSSHEPAALGGAGVDARGGERDLAAEAQQFLAHQRPRSPGAASGRQVLLGHVDRRPYQFDGLLQVRPMRAIARGAAANTSPVRRSTSSGERSQSTKDCDAGLRHQRHPGALVGRQLRNHGSSSSIRATACVASRPAACSMRRIVSLVDPGFTRAACHASAPGDVDTVGAASRPATSRATRSADLRRIAFLLERALEPTYRVKAFRTAAAASPTCPADEVAERAAAGTLPSSRGSAT